MQQSRWLTRRNHSDEIRVLGRGERGESLEGGGRSLVGTMTPQRQQEPHLRGEGRRRVSPVDGLSWVKAGPSR